MVRGCGLALGLGLLLARPEVAFTNFESGHVRPIALTPDGTHLCAVNTPDGRLSVFRISSDGLILVDEVPVGLEPVAVATRTNAAGAIEAWVVNHLSDDISVVELPPHEIAYVSHVIPVGDEPRDIVFAGVGDARAFITTAHRGQHRPTDPQLTTPGIGRADVWVFDAEGTREDVPPSPLTIVALFGDTPRGLARSADGTVVYASVFQSGNGTTTLPAWTVRNGGGLPPPPPSSRYPAERVPPVGLIVKHDSRTGAWLDELGRDWQSHVPFSLPDFDVFRIDATAAVPEPLGPPVTTVGTTLFNLAERPGTSRLYVTNLEARNHVRFEPALRGHVVDTRISIIDGTTVRAIDLNPHIDRSLPGGDPTVIAQTLAMPTAIAFTADGDRAIVTAFGSGQVAFLDADALEAGAIVGPRVATGLGPSGLVVDDARDQVYVMHQLDHTVAIVGGLDSDTPTVRASMPVGHDPRPATVRSGQPFLYDASRTSAYGDAACATCHLFGDLDALAWDLGDPGGRRIANRNPTVKPSFVGFPIRLRPFHPMKGPMTTQSLRGLDHAGPMHWRGDRTDRGARRISAFDERKAFRTFNAAFVTLLGRPRKLRPNEMREFTDFVFTLRYPPNPNAQLTADPVAAAGRQLFSTAGLFRRTASDASGPTCDSCHSIQNPVDPVGTLGRSFPPTVDVAQEFKAPHLRNLYQKVGMFGLATHPRTGPATPIGPQIRGFGFLHDGSIPTIDDFLRVGTFEFDDTRVVADREALVRFLLTFDTGAKPELGFQTTVRDTAMFPWAFLFVEGCTLVAKAVIDSERRGFVFDRDQQAFVTDRRAEAPYPIEAFQEIVAALPIPAHFTCVPRRDATRRGIDHDDDGVLDGDE